MKTEKCRFWVNRHRRGKEEKRTQHQHQTPMWRLLKDIRRTISCAEYLNVKGGWNTKTNSSQIGTCRQWIHSMSPFLENYSMTQIFGHFETYGLKHAKLNKKITIFSTEFVLENSTQGHWKETWMTHCCLVCEYKSLTQHRTLLVSPARGCHSGEAYGHKKHTNH